MLDLGFLPDVEKIINLLPVKRQTMLFSATMPGAVIGLARRYMSQPTHIRATAPDDEGATVANTKQFVYRAHNMDKPEMVARILQADGRGLAMIFCRTKRTAADLADQLGQRGFASGAVHGDLGQGAREQALRAFRNGKVDVLVCTDVAARGIDVEGVTHVINYQTPEDEKTYLHRIGRTGRAGAKGTAITLVDWDDIPRWQLINKALDLGLGDPAETYSTSPHLYTDLSIPEGTKGTLPRSERTRAGLDAEELEDLGEVGGRGPRGRGGRDGRDGRRGSRDDRSGRSERSDEREASSRTPRRRRRTRGGAPLDAAGQQPAAQAAVGAGEAEAGEAARTRAAVAARVAGPLLRGHGRADRRRDRRRHGRGPVGGDRRDVRGRREAAPSPHAPVGRPGPGRDGAAVGSGARRRARRGGVRPGGGGRAAPSPHPQGGRGRRGGGRHRRGHDGDGRGRPEAHAQGRREGGDRRRHRRGRDQAASHPQEGGRGRGGRRDRGPVAEEKPKRVRKTAAKKAEAAVDTAEGAEAKPRRRTRKAAEGEAVEIPAQSASEAEEKPKRVRKTAAKKAEAAVDTAEGAEAKPRRTRKTVPAQAAPEGGRRGRRAASPDPQGRRVRAGGHGDGGAEGAPHP